MGVLSLVIFYLVAVAIIIGVDAIMICYVEDLDRVGPAQILRPELHGEMQKRKVELD
eukprot:NODE_5394_length_313_cov_170.363636_g4783_i0.p2 GENE.NODE_5394_length_313_cov_170.363636_g4783_i0~~NODE_5394_length_313_cov_170.363636_g4783_i0.p2  ORF type:complete len:64 (+),score=16.02 NODE_5394_length_313_cov_170.363636_g4783_i0:23-193(+)